ncbi:MAG TPA: hypothetical protein VEA16_15735 [Vicinamibacterales bacterium]|nr:hypothetical protein [Vicinamibacterales bacterium]
MADFTAKIRVPVSAGGLVDALRPKLTAAIAIMTAQGMTPG